MIREIQRHNPCLPRSAMKNKLLSIGVLILATTILAYGGYSYWARTPQYALQQIVKAVETHDVELFRKYVDVNTVASRFIGDMMDSVTQDEESGDEASELGKNFGKGLVNLMKPRLTEIIAEQLDKYVETGDLGKSAQADKKEAISLTEVQDRIGKHIRDLKYVKKEGKIAIAGIGIYNEKFQKELTLELKLREKDGGYWQLVELSNFGSMLQEINSLSKAKLDDLNRPAKDKMAQALTVSSIRKTQETDEHGFSQKVFVTIAINNSLPIAVSGFEADLQITDISGRTLKKISLRSDQPIPGSGNKSASWTIPTNKYISKEASLYNTPEGQLKFQFSPSSVSFTDGTMLQLKKSLD